MVWYSKPYATYREQHHSSWPYAGGYSVFIHSQGQQGAGNTILSKVLCSQLGLQDLVTSLLYVATADAL